MAEGNDAIIGKMRFASILFAAALSVFADNGETLLEKGVECYRKGQYTDALLTFEKAVKLSPADSRSITYLAITRAALGDCSGTIGELRLQASRNADLEIRRLAGLAFVRCMSIHNRFPDLLPVLGELQSIFPDDPDVMYESAKAYNRAWSFEANELLHRAPDSYRAHELSAELAEGQGKYTEAVTQFKKAIAKNPAALTLHYRLGRALMSSSQDPAVLAEAREQFEAELKLNPGDAGVEYQIAQSYLNEQKKTEAGVHLAKAVNLAPTFAEALVALGKLRLEEKQHEEAIALLERAVRLQPGTESTRTVLIQAYRDAGRNKEAQREQKALDKLHAGKPAAPQS